MTHFAFPYRIAADGRTAGADLDEHIRRYGRARAVHQPGERVNRPDFGSGARQLVFAGAAPELATALQLIVKGGLQRWLGEC